MKRVILIGLGGSLLLVASACRSPLDEHWGKSFEALADQQIANPDAPNPEQPLEGLDPETGHRVAKRYYEGQEKQRQRNAPAVIITER